MVARYSFDASAGVLQPGVVPGEGGTGFALGPSWRDANTAGETLASTAAASLVAPRARRSSGRGGLEFGGG